MTDPIGILEKMKEELLSLIANPSIKRDAKVELHLALEAVESAIIVQEG